MEICCICSSLGMNHFESSSRFKIMHRNEKLISPIHKKRDFMKVLSCCKWSHEPEGTIIRSLPPPLIPIHNPPILPPLEPIIEKVDSDRLQFFSENPLLFRALNSSGKPKTFQENLSNFETHPMTHHDHSAAVGTFFQVTSPSTRKSKLINQQFTSGVVLSANGHNKISFCLRSLTPIVNTAGMTPSQLTESCSTGASRKNATTDFTNCLVCGDSSSRQSDEIQACSGWSGPFFHSVRKRHLVYRCKAGGDHCVIDRINRNQFHGGDERTRLFPYKNCRSIIDE